MRPRATIRTRLTMLYGGMFLLAGIILLAVTWLLFARNLPEVEGAPKQISGEVQQRAGTVVVPNPLAGQQRQLEAAQNVRTAALRELVVQGSVALAGTGVLSFGLGWLLAGRALRPIHDIHATARQISHENLAERVVLDGPDDELTDLAATLNEMLDRLDRAFAAERLFIANASHELRTPLAVARSAVDLLAERRQPTTQHIEAAVYAVRTATDRSTALLEALLTLARSHSGVVSRHTVDLAELLRASTADLDLGAGHPSVEVSLVATPVVVGDATLLRALVDNLVANAVRYNIAGGFVRVTLDQAGDQVRLVVENSGPLVPEEDIAGLFEPFRRPGQQRIARSGAGLGLSIVRSVAKAHGGDVHAVPRRDGGLHAEVILPALTQ